MRKLLLTLLACIVAIATNAMTVYFQNTAGWGAVYVHYWGGSSPTGWPGIEVKTTIDAGGTTYYQAEITDNSTGVIFNNGGNGQQTKDLNNPVQGNVYSYAANNNQSGNGYSIGTITESNGTYTFTPVGAVEIKKGYYYFPVSTYNVTTAYLYTWNPQLTGWPGTEMTKQTINGVEYWVYEGDSSEMTATFGGIQLNTGDSSNQKELTNISLKPGDIIAINEGVIGNDPDNSKPDIPDPDPEYMSWWVNLNGDFHTEGDNGAQPNKEGIASWTNQAIGSYPVYLKVWDGNDRYYYATAPVKLDTWTTLTTADQGTPTTIVGQTSDCVYNVEYNVIDNQVKFTLVSGGTSEPTLPKWYLYTEANWGAGTEMVLQSPTANQSGEYVYKLSMETLPAPISFKIFSSETGQEEPALGYAENGAFNGANTLEAKIGGGNFASYIEMSNATFTLYYNPDGQSWLQLEGTEVAPNTLYIRAESAEWGQVATLTKTSDELTQKGEYTYSGNVAALNGQFKVAQYNDRWDGLNYGAGSDAALTVSTSSIEAWYNSGTNFTADNLEDVTVTFYYNPNRKEASYLNASKETVDDNIVELFVIGNVNGVTGEWKADNGVSMDYEGDESFRIEGLVLGSETEAGDAYFSFTTKLSDSADNWDGLGKRFTAVSNNYEFEGLELNQELEVEEALSDKEQDVNNAFKVPAGKYNIFVGLQENVIAIEPIEFFTASEEPGGESEPFDVTFVWNSTEYLQDYNSSIPEDPTTWPKDGTTGYKYVITDMESEGVNIKFTASSSYTPGLYQIISTGALTMRLGKDATMTVYAPKGGKINKIISTGNTGGAKFTANVGTLTADGTKNFNWVAPEGGVSSVTFTGTATAQIQTFEVIGVTGDGTEEPEPEPQPISVWVVGAGDGIGWDLPGKEYKGENGVVTFTIDNLSKFKASTKEASEWDGDDGFNSGCYGTGSTAFGDAVYPNGQTLPMVAWGEDQEVPWAGNYTITMDFNNNTITAKTSTPKPAEAPAIYVRGDMNGWLNSGAQEAWKLENVSWDATAQTGTWKLDNVKISKGQSFKIADMAWGAVNYGGATNINANQEVSLSYNSSANISLAQNFEGNITFTITASKSKATILFSMEEEAKDPDQFYVIGTLQQGAWNPTIGVKMENNGQGIYTANDVVLVESGGSTGFAIVANLGLTDQDWGTVNALRYGPSVNDTPAVIGENTDIAVGDLTWKIMPGTYKMIFDYKQTKLTIEAINVELPELYLRGSMNEWGATEEWKFEKSEDGIYTLSDVELSKGDQFKIAASDWSVYTVSLPASGIIPNVEYILGNYSGENENMVMTIDMEDATIVYNAESNAFEIQGLGKLEEMPEDLYMMGDINDFAWATNKGLAPAVAEAGVYTWKNVTVNPSDGNPDYGYVNLATKLAETENDWETVNSGDRYGAPTQNLLLEAVQVMAADLESTPNVAYYPANISAEGCQSWMIPVGTYDITINLNSFEAAAQEAAEAYEPAPIPDDAFIVYNNGAIYNDLHLYGWYNESMNEKAPNPANAEYEAFEFKAGDLTYDWGQAGYAAASMGINMEAPLNTGILNDATLHFDWYKEGTGSYTIRLTSGQGEGFEYDYPLEGDANQWNTVSINIKEQFETLSEQWNNNINDGVGYVFSVILDDGVEGDAFYFDRVYYTGVDNDWVAPKPDYPEPETVPAPAAPKEDVYSFFSDYGKVSYTVGGWNQSTNVTDKEIDGQPVLFLRNFNYLGLESFDINVADYDYMHVDYWTAQEDGVSFGFVPISLNPTVDTPIYEGTVVPNQWNSYDVPLTFWTEGATKVDLSAIEQMKFVANLPGTTMTDYGYIANVYFWKEPAAVENALTFDDFDMAFTKNNNAIETASVPVSIETESEFQYKGFQFDITLPEGLEVSAVALNEAYTDGKAEFTLYTNKEGETLPENTYRVISHFTEASNITKYIVTLTVSGVYSDVLVAGENDVTIQNTVRFSTPGGSDISGFEAYTGIVDITINNEPATAIDITKSEVLAPSFKDTEMATVITQGEELGLTIELTPEESTDEIAVTTDNSDVTAVYENGMWVVSYTGTADLEDALEVTITASVVGSDLEDTLDITIQPVVLGDSNDSGSVNVADVVTTANYIVEKPVETFDFPNANVVLTEENGVQVINDQDVVATINIILDKPYSRNVRRHVSDIVTSDVLVSDNFRVVKNAPFTVGVNLDNSYSYSALQAVINVPEGMKVHQVTAGPRAAAHELIYNITENGKVNVILFSMNNSSFAEGNEALFNLVVTADENCGDITMDAIHASDASANGYDLGYQGGLNASTSGINGLFIDVEEGVRYYDVHGIEVKNPEKGQILIRVNGNQTEKVVVK